MPKVSKYGCRKGERFSSSKKKKGGSGCYVPNKGSRGKKCAKGTKYVKKAKSCMTPCKSPYRRMRKSPYHCRLTKTRMSKGIKKKTSGGIAFMV